MRIKVLENEVLLVSDLSYKQYTTISRYNPDVFKLKDENNEDVFRVYMGEKGSVSNYGIVFDLNKASEKAVVTLPFDKDEEVTTESIVLHYGKVIANLKKIEKQIEEAEELVDIEIKELKNSVEFINL